MSNTANRVTNPMKVITGPDTRWSYANVWEPKSINGDAAKYSVSLIIPKSDTKTVAKIKAAIEAAYQEGQAKLKGNGRSVPPLAAIKNPLRDGDVERPDDPAYAGAYFVNANSATAPGIVDADRNPVLTRAACASKQIPEETLQTVTAEVLGQAGFSESLLRRLIKSVLVCNGNVLIFRFFDGTEITRTWQDRSRSQSWTDEMKAAARQKALERRNPNA